MLVVPKSPILRDCSTLSLYLAIASSSVSLLIINISVGSVHNRIKALRANGYIRKFTIQPNPETMGYDLTVIIQMQIEVAKLSLINDQLQEIEQITTIYNVTGKFDITCVGRFENRLSLNDVLQKILKIDGVKRTDTQLVLQVLKEEWLSNTH